MDRAESLSAVATCCNSMKQPRQNRCTPFGTIEATHYRGTLMGNRGDLHAPDGSLGRQWRSQRWISCLLDTGDCWKAPMGKPGHYYPLFFHDEAVALAAGHRPCGQCRPEALAAFVQAWKAGHGFKASDWVPLREIDRQLHSARVSETHHRPIVDSTSLPDGTFIWCPKTDDRPMLKIEDHLFPWSHAGYDKAQMLKRDCGKAFLLTPTMVVKTIAAGYASRPTSKLQFVATEGSIDPVSLSAY